MTVEQSSVTTGTVISVNISEGKGTAKKPVPNALVDAHGIRGDAHAGPWHRQVSLLGRESIDRFTAMTGRSTGPGEFAENITTEGIDLSKVSILDRFRMNEVELEVAQIGKECHGDSCAIFEEVGNCIMPREGIFTRVLSGGRIAAGEAISWIPRVLMLEVITMSDRASRGEYPDRSGPRIRELLEDFFAEKRWHVSLESLVLPDDAQSLRRELESARAGGTDVVITTGGTGISPRDITPDTIMRVADKIIPGIMEQVRLKFGEGRPQALLSRSIAAVAGGTLIYALPGGLRAVEEYLGEILKTLEHAICMVNRLDIH